MAEPLIDGTSITEDDMRLQWGEMVRECRDLIQTSDSMDIGDCIVVDWAAKRMAEMQVVIDARDAEIARLRALVRELAEACRDIHSLATATNLEALGKLLARPDVRAALEG